MQSYCKSSTEQNIKRIFNIFYVEMQRNFFKFTKKNEETKFDEVNEELFLPECFLMFFVFIVPARI